MAIQNRDEAVKRALAKKTNSPGMCQQITRSYYDAPSAGDRDGDRDADANDGWAAEPHSARHAGDRNPPVGVPLYFMAPGRFGHRTISVADGGVNRSSDFNEKTKRYEAGVMGTGTIAEIEKAMNYKYVGWSSTITGFPIPLAPKPVRRKQRPANIRKALDALRSESKKANGSDKDLVTRSKELLLKIKPK